MSIVSILILLFLALASSCVNSLHHTRTSELAKYVFPLSEDYSMDNSSGSDVLTTAEGHRSLWEQWRWGTENMSEFLEDAKTNETLRINETVLKICADETLAVHTPGLDQFDKALDSEVAFKLISLASHIYVLCIECGRKFPGSWKEKLSIVNVTEADKCWPNETFRLHRVTYTHQLVVQLAKAHKFRAVMILEQDFTLPKDGVTASNMLDRAALTDFIIKGQWNVLRFDYLPWAIFTKELTCKQECQCAKEALCRDVCIVASGCDMRSSAAYMIHESIFNQFLALNGTIDFHVLQSFEQSYIVPPLLYQTNYYDWEVTHFNEYRNHCMVG